MWPLSPTVLRSPQSRCILSYILSTQEAADGVLRSAQEVCGDQGELADGQGPVVRRGVLPLARCQQWDLPAACEGMSTHTHTRFGVPTRCITPKRADALLKKDENPIIFRLVWWKSISLPLSATHHCCGACGFQPAGYLFTARIKDAPSHSFHIYINQGSYGHGKPGKVMKF